MTSDLVQKELNGRLQREREAIGEQVGHMDHMSWCRMCSTGACHGSSLAEVLNESQILQVRWEGC